MRKTIMLALAVPLNSIKKAAIRYAIFFVYSYDCECVVWSFTSRPVGHFVMDCSVTT